MSAHCHAICNGEDKYEVKHFDNRFTVNLVSKKCSCRYWQLSGLSCCHAISCILFKTNNLDEYVADCYSVHHFKQTYSHCLNPVEGMNSWPASDRAPLRAPGYVKMPGRPKTERRREPTEVRKATKISKTGTVIRCSKCHLPGHNKSTCTNISGAGPSQAGGSRSAGGSSQPTGYKSAAGSQRTGSQSAAGGNPNAIVMLSNTQKSTTSGTKRTSTSNVSSAQSMKKAKATNSQNVIKSSARARVSTIPSGSATINLQARVPTSNVNCSVNVQLTGGTASAHVSAQEPAKRKPIPKKYGTSPLQILPPWQSDKM